MQRTVLSIVRAWAMRAGHLDKAAFPTIFLDWASLTGPLGFLKVMLGS